MKKKLALIITSIMMLCILGACVPKNTDVNTDTKQGQTSNLNTDENKEQTNDEKNSTNNNEKREVTKENAEIGVIQLMDHTSLNIILDAFNERMQELGYNEDQITIKNAMGDMSNLTTIVQNFEGYKKDVVLAITTPVAQACLGLAKDTPVVFSAVTDPIKAGVVSDFDKTDKGMTGTSDIIQVDKILDLALEITPNIHSIGYIYNPSEDNSVSNLEKVKEYAKAHNIKVEEATISTGAELQTAAQSIIKKVDAIFCANDNTVAESMPILMKVANAEKIPVYVGADSMVMDGGFATVGIDYNDLGRESADMVDMIIKGKKPEDINVKVFKDDLSIYINQATLDDLGIKLPKDIKDNPKLKMIE